VNASIIDVAIVLVSVYVGLSVLASWVQEQIASLTHLRGEQLYRGVLSLLANSTKAAEAIYSHPLITASVDKDEKNLRPSYLEARNFSLALWQGVHQGLSQPPTGAAANLIAAPATLFAQLGTTVSDLPDDAKELKKTLAALINSASGDYNRLLAVTDDWFNAQMDRVSGWYKRTTQWWLVGIGAVIVIAGGVDSIDIAKQAYSSPAATAAFAKAIAQSVAAQPSGKPTQDSMTSVASEVSNAFANEPTVKVFWSAETAPKTAGGWIEKAFGLLFTVAAVSLGAPFWFDILKSLVNVRMAGDKPDGGTAAAPKNADSA
jgi:hypothetical protein